MGTYTGSVKFDRGFLSNTMGRKYLPLTVQTRIMILIVAILYVRSILDYYIVYKN